MFGHILLNQVNRVLENQDFVTHNHSHQRDESEDRGQTKGAIHQSETNERSRNHQSQSCHTNGGNTILLEVEQQEEVHDDQCNGDATNNLRHGLVAIFYLAAHLGTDALWQFYLLVHHTGNLLLYRCGIYALCKLGSNGDTTFATTMHDATLAPLGLHLGYLTQRNGGIGTAQTSRHH